MFYRLESGKVTKAEGPFKEVQNPQKGCVYVKAVFHGNSLYAAGTSVKPVPGSTYFEDTNDNEPKAGYEIFEMKVGSNDTIVSIYQGPDGKAVSVPFSFKEDGGNAQLKELSIDDFLKRMRIENSG